MLRAAAQSLTHPHTPFPFLKAVDQRQGDKDQTAQEIAL